MAAMLPTGWQPSPRTRLQLCNQVCSLLDSMRPVDTYQGVRRRAQAQASGKIRYNGSARHTAFPDRACMWE